MIKLSVLSVIFASATLAANYVPAVADFSRCPTIGGDTACGVLLVINPYSAQLADYPITAVLLTDISNRAVVAPFDGSDDTLFGVLNESGDAIPSISLGTDRNHPGRGMTNQPIFGFDGDGLCVYAAAGSGCPYEKVADPWGGQTYAGPGTTFSFVNTNPNDPIGNYTSGTISFTGGLANLGFTYFSLEDTFGVGACVFSCASSSALPQAQSISLAAQIYQISYATLYDGTPVQTTVVTTAAAVAQPEPQTFILFASGVILVLGFRKAAAVRGRLNPSSRSVHEEDRAGLPSAANL